MSMEPEKKFMEAAIEEAKKAAEKGDYAIGAVVVKGDDIIGRGWDSMKSTHNPVLHAEVVAIQEACKKKESPYLEDCIVYSTVEPCPMCAAAAIWAKVKGIVFGTHLEDLVAYANKHGNKTFTWRTIDMTCKEVLEKGIPRVELVEGFMREECKALFALSR